MAAADIKPAITGCEIKLTKKPILRNPKKICTTLINKPVKITSSTYGSVNGVANLLTPVITKIDVIATGPILICLEVPNKAYTINGIKQAYNP